MVAPSIAKIAIIDGIIDSIETPKDKVFDMREIDSVL